MEQIAPDANVPTPEGELVTPPAAEATPEQAVSTEPQSPTVQLDADTQKYLEAQGIKLDDPAQALAEMAKRHQALRNGKPEVEAPKPSNDEVKDALKQPVNTPSGVTPPKRNAAPISDIEIDTVSMLVQNQYKDVKVDADFYKSMLDDGFNPLRPDNTINLTSVKNYAAYKQKLIEADKAIQSAQPNAAAIPEPSNQIQYADTPRVTISDENTANNIIIWSNQEKRFGRPVHPNYDEAVAYIQSKA